MKKNILLLAILLIAINSYSQNQNPDELLNKLISENKVIGISAGYAIDGNTEWQSAVGYADEKKKDRLN